MEASTISRTGPTTAGREAPAKVVRLDSIRPRPRLGRCILAFSIGLAIPFIGSEVLIRLAVLFH
ncbi:MAG: hypothetical protein AB1634_08055 [Thermodesulfobacteriota bacterium]